MHKLPRRSFIALSGAAALSASWKTRALAKSAKVTAGYVHALAVDGQLWLADAMDAWKAEGLSMQFVEFQNGNEAFQALTAGTLDVLTTGAVISRYPATGVGKVFLINDIEFATAQLWCHPEMGIKGIADLKGRKITTTTGTTAHFFLVSALRANGIAPKDVLIINQRIEDAVEAFVAKAVAAVALWIPHNLVVKQRDPGAKMLADASAYYPDTAVVNGWVARNGFHEKKKTRLPASSAHGPAQMISSLDNRMKRPRCCATDTTQRWTPKSSGSNSTRKRCTRLATGGRCTPKGR